MPVSSQYAMRMLGRPVIAHHVDGSVYRGILHSVRDDGIYLRPMSGTGYVSSNINDVNVEQADGSLLGSTEQELVFWPFFFLPFFALAALGPWGWWW